MEEEENDLMMSFFSFSQYINLSLYRSTNKRRKRKCKLRSDQIPGKNSSEINLVLLLVRSKKLLEKVFGGNLFQ